MAIIKKEKITQQIISAGVDGTDGKKIGADTMENSTKIPQKIKSRTIIQFSNSTPEYLAEQNKNANEEGGTRGHTRSRIRYVQ